MSKKLIQLVPGVRIIAPASQIVRMMRESVSRNAATQHLLRQLPAIAALGEEPLVLEVLGGDDRTNTTVAVIRHLDGTDVSDPRNVPN